MLGDHGAGAAGNFAAQCPGGAAPSGSAASLAGRCKAAEITATRQGILVTICFYAWAAFHYLLGAFGLARQLAAAAEQRRAREA